MDHGEAAQSPPIQTIFLIPAIVCALLVLASCRLIAAPVGELSPNIDAQIAANAREFGIPAQSVFVTRNGAEINQGHTGT